MSREFVIAEDSGDATLLARYRAMVEDCSDIIILHEGGRIVLATGTLARLLGHTAQEFQDGGYLQFVHPDDIDEALAVRGTPPRGQVWTATYRLRHACGHYLWFEVRTRGVYDEETGAFLREVSVGRDVTERKEHELRMRAAHDRAEMANRAKSAFLAGMSHELRTPLNAILGFTGSIESEVFGPLGHARYREYVTLIREAGEKLLGMLSNVLDVALMESGRYELNPKEFDLAESVAECIGFVSEAARNKHVTLEQSVSPTVLDADPSAVRKILLNLLSNAVTFTPPAGRVCVECRREGNDALLSIRDTGIGMSEEQLSRLAEPFAEISSRAAFARKGAGAGVGLALSRALAEAHGGSLEIESAIGRGTLATVRFGASERARGANSAQAS
jgi:PAS domain S-box-containing protein